MKKALLLIVIIILIVIILPTPSPLNTLAESPPEFSQGSPRLASLLGADDLEDYAKVTEPRQFLFPQDHGPHPEYRNEWWYVTGNLDGENGERFGFEMTLFRFSVAAEVAADTSAWRSNQVYIGHFAITDLAADKFRTAVRYSRGSAGLAGANSDPLHVWLEDWEFSDATNAGCPGTRSVAQWCLHAKDDDIAIELLLTAEKSPVLNGIRGLSQKSAVPGNASYYYSIPRMQTTGTLRSGDNTYQVSGFSWLDREWGSGGLAKEQQGWDWFALQLTDGSDLMFYNLRQMDGTQDPHSAGTFVAADGTSTPIAANDIAIEVLHDWESPYGGRYPMAWRIKIAARDLNLRITPIMTGQELSTLVRYWEGAVDVEGHRGSDHEISGRGYVELTGYAND